MLCAGQFLPKHKDAVIGFVKTLSEKQRDQFVNLVNNSPKRDASLFTEIGHGGENDESTTGIYKKISAMAKAKVSASEGKVEFSAALLQV